MIPRFIMIKFLLYLLLKDFIAHPCCQKWITKKFYGGLDIREMSFGIFKLSTWIKVRYLRN